MMALLMTGVVKIEKVYQAGTFFNRDYVVNVYSSCCWNYRIVGSIASYYRARSIITIITTFAVMIVSGKVTQYVLEKGVQDGESTRS